MDVETELYLATLAGDPHRWMRMGFYGATKHVEGVLETLASIGSMTDDESLRWKEMILSAFPRSRATSTSSVGEFSTGRIADAPSSIPQFLEMIPVSVPPQDVPGVCSFQILGIERYDSKVAIVWRMTPLLEADVPTNPIDFGSYAPNSGAEGMELTDDVGTDYSRREGSSGGRVERVGRFGFIPALPEDARLLYCRWDAIAFEICLT